MHNELQDCFVVFVRDGAVERPVAACTTYAEAVKCREQFRQSGQGCVGRRLQGVAEVRPCREPGGVRGMNHGDGCLRHAADRPGDNKADILRQSPIGRCGRAECERIVA